MSPQQQALIIPSPKADFVLVTRDVPQPGPGEVLLKTLAVSLNPADWMQHDFDIRIPSYPAVIGLDFAGEIVSVGEGVEGWMKGDRVLAQSDDLGAFQQYAILPSEWLIRIPDNISIDQAATLPVVLGTALIGLFGDPPIGIGLNPSFSWDQSHSGETALVIGGSTSVGQHAIQLLKFLGYSSIISYASARHSDFLKSLGATECIDRTVTSINELPKSLSSKAQVVFDCLGLADSQNAACSSLTEGGKAVTCRPGPLWDGIKEKLQGENKIMIGVYGSFAIDATHAEFSRPALKNLTVMLERGIILPNRYEIIGGLSDIPAGLERLKKGEVSGIKLVAHPHD